MRYVSCSLAGVLLTGLALGACSSSTNSASSTTSTASATTTSGGSSSGGSGGSGGSSEAGKIRSLSSSVQAAEHASYKAVYTTQNSGGTSQTITIEQKPPKSVFSSGSGSVINDGTHTYFCSSSGGQQSCVSEAATTNPLASITAIFSPQTVLSALQQAETSAAAHAAGYSATFSNGTYGGQPSTCAEFTSTGKAVRYCVTDSGILAYVQSAGGSFTLSSYSSSPADSDFALPSGATVITVPTIPTTP